VKTPAVVVGLGQMGGVFSHALLRAGHPVYPVTRSMDAAEVAGAVSEPELVVVAVGEAELHPVLRELPDPWREGAVLLQNELMPRDWQRHGLSEPTVAVVWFEKKKGTPIKPILPTPVAGPKARLLVDALAGLDIPARVVEHGAPLLRELVTKNLYILTANITGLETGGTVGEMWRDHRELATEVFDECLAIQQHLAGTELDRDALLGAMVAAFEADPEHGATGRSAPRRLARARENAREAGLATPRLHSLQ